VVAGYAAALYTWKTLVPLGLLPLYAMPDADPLMSPRYVLPALAAFAATLVVIALRRRAPALAFAWIAFLLILAPTSGLAQAGPQIAADRYTYLACTPFALLAAGLVFLWKPAGPIAPRALAAAAIVVALGALTYRQTAVWHDARSLWEYMRAHAPENHHTLGHLAGVREREGLAAASPGERIARLEEAGALYERAWELAPLPVHKIGTAYVYRGLAEAQPERAAERLRSALRAADTALERARVTGGVKPSWRRLRGGLLLDQGRFTEAAKELAAVVRETPDDVTARSDLGVALLFAGDPTAAAAHLRQAVQLQPEVPRLWATLGLALEKAGQADAARDAAREVERLCGTAAAPDDPACPAPDRR
jgi:tetratricopeptide (TPR) repeat protein